MLLNKKKEKSGNSIFPEAVNSAPALACAVLTIMTTAFIASGAGAFDGFANELILALVQIAAFLIPGLIYFIFYGKGRLTSNFITRGESGCTKFTVISGFLLVVTVILTKAISAYMSPSEISGSVFSENASVLTIVLVSVILPPLFEEILVRGFILSAYEKKCGGALAIVASSVIFAFLHFSVKDFLTYFAAGIILGTLVYITRSVLGAMAVHLINNVISLYFDGAVFKIVSESNSGLVTLFVLTIIFLILLYLWLGELENICTRRFFKATEEDKPSQGARLLPEGYSLAKGARLIVASPYFLLCAILFLIVSAFII